MPIDLHINGKTIEAAPGPSLFDYAEQHCIRVPTSCHKNGRCRECLVEVVSGMEHLSQRSPEEMHLEDGFRLSCRSHIVVGEGHINCHTLRRATIRIEERGCIPADSFVLDPAITHADGRVYVDGNPVAHSSGPVHGLAVDLGTTTVVTRLIDLATGRVVAGESFENPQRFGGSDVMARIRYDTDHKGRLLKRTLLSYLGHAIEAMACDPLTIYEVIVCGNTTMRDLFFGLPVETIGQRPYRSITEHELNAGIRKTTSLSTTAKRLSLRIHPSARVCSLPLVGGHIGADTAACLLAIDMAREERLVALIDIGTNTEVIVGNRKGIFAASCPAGPAFEGGGITCGIPALEGAVEAVQLNESGVVSVQVIGGGRPEGVCGSGLIDLLGELLRTGRMNELGRLTDGSDRFDLNVENNIRLTERDISELAQAKGANVAGLRIVLKSCGVEISELDRCYIAGGFGRRINLESARRIGLIPDIPSEKILQIGNASIEGATIALRSRTRRGELQELIRHATHVELEMDDEFFDFFVDGCQFLPFRKVRNQQ